MPPPPRMHKPHDTNYFKRLLLIRKMIQKFEKSSYVTLWGEGFTPPLHLGQQAESFEKNVSKRSGLQGVGLFGRSLRNKKLDILYMAILARSTLQISLPWTQFTLIVRLAARSCALQQHLRAGIAREPRQLLL